MKKIIFMLAFLFCCHNAWGAATVTILKQRGKLVHNNTVIVKLVAHTDGSLAVTLEPGDPIMAALNQRYVLRLKSYYGGTAPKDNSDLKIEEMVSNSEITTARAAFTLLSETGNGANFIDNATDNQTNLENPDGTGDYVQIKSHRPLKFTLTNNDVSGAITYLEFDVTPPMPIVN